MGGGTGEVNNKRARREWTIRIFITRVYSNVYSQYRMFNGFFFFFYQ